MLKRMVIAQYERGLYIKDRSIQRILTPGVYWVVDPRVTVTRVDTRQAEFSNTLLDSLLSEKPELVETVFRVVDLAEYEVGLVRERGNLVRVLPSASRYVFWKHYPELEIEVMDTREDYRVSPEVAAIVTRRNIEGAMASLIYPAEIKSQTVGLLWIDGELVDTLGSGVHVFWLCNRSVKVEHVEMRLQSLDVSGQEILTRDRVSLRINLSATYRVVDAVKARLSLSDFQDYLYRKLQFVLREAVGTRTLDALLADKSSLNTDVFGALGSHLADYGMQVDTVGVKDIILPGEMKDILNQVVATEKAAQANVIRRREETAATRSLLNTAKLMDEHPTLMRLKELEALEKVTEKVERLTVYGGLDGLLQDTVKLQL
ncbi:MAG: slipin family protein [Acidiferrobacterales bacterium]|nr:slipin family protein [Acidiferrobacterales bacterium]